jgi:ABC-type transporter lipoprotein component MlaA
LSEIAQLLAHYGVQPGAYIGYPLKAGHFMMSVT